MRIPFFAQKNNYYCGPAIVQMATAAFGIKTTQKEAARRAKTATTNGTSTQGLTRALKSFGLRVTSGNNKTIPVLQRALAANKIVIVCYTEPILEWGHYAIVTEFRDDTIILIDPDAPKGKTSLLVDEFKRRWKDPVFTHSLRWAAFVDQSPPTK